MISSYTLQGYEHYRFVGKKLYRLPYNDAKFRMQPLKEISKIVCGGSIGYSLVNKQGERRFIALSHLKPLLVKERMNLNYKLRGQPF